MGYPECPTVLLADDNENDVRLMQRALRSLNNAARVLVVPDGEAVLAYLEGEGKYADRVTWPVPGLLFLDECMPSVSGRDALFWLRTQPKFRELPVVVWSDALLPEQVIVVNKLQAAWCRKGCGFDEMTERLQGAISVARRLARGVESPQGEN